MIPSERNSAADIDRQPDDADATAELDGPDAIESTSGVKRLPPSSVPAFAGCVLSPSELQTLRQLARGLSYSEAAREAHRSPSTVRSLLHTAYKRLGVTTIAQALVICWHAGWLDVVPRDGVVVELADRRVTWSQRLYLEAFDQSLRAGDDPKEVERTRHLRDAALEGMYKGEGKERPLREPSSDPLGRLAQDLIRLNRRAA